MAEFKREMDIAAQLRMLAEHSRSKGPVLREAAEVIEAMAFRLVALREELDGMESRVTATVLEAVTACITGETAEE